MLNYVTAMLTEMITTMVNGILQKTMSNTKLYELNICGRIRGFSTNKMN